MNLIRKIYTNFEEYVCAVLVGTMVACLVTQVIVRMLFGSSLAFTEELSRFAFLWSVYVGAALAVKKSAHVRITAQFCKFNTKNRLFFRFVCDAIWVAFNILLIVQSIDVIRDGLAYPETSPTLGVVKAWVEMIIPFGFSLMTWRLFEQYYTNWKAGTLGQLVNYEEMT